MVEPHAGAQSLSFPLEGYFRPGKCMPVAYSGEPPTQVIIPGAIPLELHAPIATVVPVLMLGEQAASLGSQTFVPLTDRQKLVLVIGDDPADAELIFPENSTIVVHRSLPIDGVTLAWETVDAVVSDQPMPTSTRDALLAQGTTLVVRSTQKPDDSFPWQPFAGGWIVQSIAPNLVNNSAAIYEPTTDWRPAATAPTRRVLLGISTLAALVGLATFVAPVRWRRSIQVVVLTAMIVGLVMLYRRSSPVHLRTVRIDVLRNGVGLEDRWDYFKTNLPAKSVASGKPVPIDLTHARNCKLIESVHGASIGWQFDLEPNAALAFVSRTVATVKSEPAQPEPLVPSSFTTMMQTIYGQAGFVTRGAGPNEASQYTYIQISDR